LIRRHRGISVAAFFATLLIVAISTVFLFQLKAKEQVARTEASRATVEADKAKIAEAKAQDETIAALQAKQLAEASLIRSALSLAEAAEREGNGKLMLEALAEVPESKRSRVWHYLANQADTSIATIKTDAKTIVGIAPDRSSAGIFVVADSDGWITRMNVRTGERLTRFKTARFNHVRLAVSPDGTRVAIADRTQKNRVAVHRLSDGKEIVAWESDPCTQIFYSPDGKLLAQTSVARFVEPPHDVKVWDADTGKLVWSREELGIGVEAQFSPNGKMIVAVADNGKVHVLSAVDGASIKEYSKPNSTTFALHPDGKWVIIGLSQNGMLAMDLQSGDKLYEIPAREADVVHLVFTPDGRRMISGMPLKDGRQAVDIWDAASGAPRLSLLGASNYAEYTAFYDDRFALHPISNELVVVGHDTKVWTIRQNDHSIAEGNSGSGTFWTDDKFLSQASLSQLVVLNQLNQNGKHSSVWRSPTDARLGWANLSVNADRTIAFVVSASELGQAIRIRLDGSDVQQLNRFDLVKGQGNRIARVSPNGERFLWSTANYVQIGVSSAIDGKPFVVFDTKSVRKVHDVRWSIDGQEVLGLVTVNAARGASESEERLVVWDANTGQQIRTTTHATPMDVLCISPDGFKFAEGGSDKNVRIRDVATLKVQQEFRVHNGPITGLAWHPTRPILATSSTDRSVRLWDIESETQLDELHGSDSAPTDLVFSPTGIRIACNDKNFNRIWLPDTLSAPKNTSASLSGGDGRPVATDVFTAVIAIPNRKFAATPVAVKDSP
jgi:WD40 repeat protein